MNARKAAVAGAFYPATPDGVKQEVEACFRHELGPGEIPSVAAGGPRRLVALVSPHAGYPFSGPAAAWGFAELAKDGAPDLFVIVGPNHRGLGAPVAVGATGSWETPLGRNDVAEDVARAIIAGSDLAEQDEWAHLLEHAIEVQLPFLQYLYGNSFRIVPIVMAERNLATAADLGKSMANALAGKNAVIVASSDLSHYEPQAAAERKDTLAIDAVAHLDEKALDEVVRRWRISMCGAGPVMATIIAAKLLGATDARLLKYITSGDIIQDREAVVGYGSLAISKVGA